MSRFVGPNLAALGDVPAVVEVDFEEIRVRRGELLKAALSEFDIDYDVNTLETSPLMIAVARGGGYEETLFRQAINDRTRALSLAKALDGDLDHIAGTYYGISRQTDIDENGDEVVEDNERFRARTALAPEAFSTAGPMGAYIFHALELDGKQDIADAYPYSEETAATYTDGLHTDAYSRGQRPTAFENRKTGDPVLAPEILIVALPSLDYGDADQALLDRVYDACTSANVRPLGDNVRVEPAQIIDYTVDIEITYFRGADVNVLVAEARQRIEAYTVARRRIGVKAEILGIGGASYVSNAESVKLKSPASDVGGAFNHAPNCTAINITTIESAGSWQN